MNCRTATTAAALLGLLATASLLAQQPRVPQDSRPPVPSTQVGRAPLPPHGPVPTRRTPPTHLGQGSCLQKAGVSRAMMERRRAIQEKTRMEVEAVCANPALSEQQKAAQVRQIRQSANEQLMAVLTPQQREIIRECQRGHVGGGGPHGHPAGPCGGFGNSGLGRLPFPRP